MFRKSLAIMLIVLLFGSSVAVACAQQVSPSAPAPAAKSTAPAAAPTTTAAAPKSTAPAAAATILKFSHTEPFGGSKDAPAQKFKSLIEQRSSGRLKVEVYPAAQLYSQKAGNEAVAAGIIFGTVTSESDLAAWDPGFEIDSVWGLFKDREHLKRFWTSEKGGVQVLKRLESKNLLVFQSHASAMLLWTRNKPVTKLSDVSGLRIRISGIPIQSDLLRAVFGIDGVAIPTEELLVASQQGMVDGAISLVVGIVGRGIHEALRYSCESPELNYTVTMPMISKIALGKLPADLQKLTLDTMKDACDACWPAVWKELEDANRRRFLAEKGTFTKMVPGEWEKVLELIKPVISKYSPKIGESLLAEAQRLR